jgi:hypothetical protein
MAHPGPLPPGWRVRRGALRLGAYLSFAPVTGALRYRRNAVVYVEAAVAVAPRLARLRKLRTKVPAIMGFVVPLTAGEWVSLSALANHTGSPWMVHAIISAMIATFLFLVAMLVVRAIDSYSGGSNSPYRMAERFRRYVVTQSTDDKSA